MEKRQPSLMFSASEAPEAIGLRRASFMASVILAFGEPRHLKM